MYDYLIACNLSQWKEPQPALSNEKMEALKHIYYIYPTKTVSKVQL